MIVNPTKTSISLGVLKKRFSSLPKPFCNTSQIVEVGGHSWMIRVEALLVDGQGARR